VEHHFERSLDTSFVHIRSWEDPGQARLRLSGEMFGVVEDASGSPIGVVSGQDLDLMVSRGVSSLEDRDASVSPTVVIGASFDLDALCKSEVSSLFYGSSKAAVVINDAGIVGIVPAEVVRSYRKALFGEDAGPSPSGTGLVFGDQALGGDYQTPTGRGKCRACGYPNSVISFNPYRPGKCVNPEPPEHDLVL
jgi:hypothetical protein